MTELICALGPDSAGTLVIRLLREARTSLDVAMYEVGPSYAWAISAAARRGVRVRMLLDGHASDGNAGTATAVSAAGGACRVLRRVDAAAHWKLVRVDGTVVAAGSGNLIWRDAPRDPRGRVPPDAQPLSGTREWWVITDATAVAGAAASAFEIAWERSRHPPAAWARRMRPEAPGDVGIPVPQVQPLRLAIDPGAARLICGGLPVAAAQLSAVQRARSRVLITVPYLSSRATAVRRLIGAAREAARRGADVRVLLGASPHAADAALLTRAGLPGRWMDPSLSTRGHAKGVIVDGLAVISSANWSRAGFGPNWEQALAVRHADAAGYFAAAWERDWAAARPLPGLGDPRPGLADEGHGYARPDVP